MMYSRKFVAVIRVDGRILREFDNTGSESSVLLPFNAEYSLLLKNLESLPARVKISIDGEDVLGGNTIIVHPNSSTELDGFMDRNGKVTNRFRFIQKTEQIIDHRGDRIDDGIVRISWQFEKQKPVKVDVYENHHHFDHHYYHHYYHPRPYRNPWYPNDWTWISPVTYGTNVCSNDKSQSSNCVGALTAFCGDSTPTASSKDIPMSAPLPDEGVTVRGSQKEEQFLTGYIGKLEEVTHTMIIRLKGTAVVAGEKIAAPVETKTKIQCPTCGIMAKSGTKYCSNCGTCVIDV